MSIPITLPPTPAPARSLPELTRVLSNWTRQAEQAIRTIGKSADATSNTVSQIADSTHTGLLSAVDWTRFNSKQPAGSYLTDSPVDGQLYLRQSGGWAALVAADGSHDGYLSSSDWATFNGKQDVLAAASASVNGYLTSSDWSLFNSKLSDAPSDGQQYARKNGAWSIVTTSGSFGFTDIEAGFASAVYLATQNIDGGNVSTSGNFLNGGLA